MIMTSVDTKEKSENKDSISAELKKTSKPYESPKSDIFEFSERDIILQSGFGAKDDIFDNVGDDIFY